MTLKSTETENNIVYPSLDELKNKCIQIRNVRAQELERVKNKLLEVGAFNIFTKLDDWEVRELKDSLKSLQFSTKDFDPEFYPVQVQKTQFTLKFMESEDDLKPSYPYLDIMVILNRISGD